MFTSLKLKVVQYLKKYYNTTTNNKYNKDKITGLKNLLILVRVLDGKGKVKM